MCAYDYIAPAAVASKVKDENSGEYEVRHAFCQMCGAAKTKCSMLCFVRDGVWEHVEGNPLAGNNGSRGRSLCAKANSTMQIVNTPTRILYPMKRVGERGEGRFIRITWTEALEYISDVLLEQKEKYGASSFGILSPQYFPVLATFGRRFLNVHGSPNYLHSGICHGQRVFSNLVTLGGSDHNHANDSHPADMRKIKLLVNWGANCEASRVNQSAPSKELDALNKGMRLIDIRPMREPLAAHADIWLPIRPGTDCALAMGILHVIISERLFDSDFVERWCNGFEDLARSVQDCDPDWAEKHTGIPASQVREAARLMATTKPMAIEIGNGVGDQSADGHWTVACIDLIVAITGNLGLAGGACSKVRQRSSAIRLKPFDVLPGRLSSSQKDIENGWMPGASELVAPETPRWFQTLETQESGPTSAYFKALMGVLSEHPNNLHAVFAQSTNPLSATRQPKLVAKALKKLDFFFVMDTEWNPSCDFADIVLPARTAYESDDLIASRETANGTWIGISQQIVDPIGESRSDAQFYLDLAVRMGYGSDFWDGSMDKYIASRLEGTGVSVERLRKTGQVLVKNEERRPDAVQKGVDLSLPKGNDPEVLFANLPGGKVQCRNDFIGGKVNNLDTGNLSAVPVYRGPAESLGTTPKIAEEYPLVFSDVHADVLSEHSYFGNVPFLRELEPYPWARINPATAKKYGIADGDWMRIESPHGWIKLQASYFECIAPDVIMGRRGWWQGCNQLGIPGYGFEDGSCETNVLYDSSTRSFDPFTSAMSKQTLVKISRDEAPRGVAFLPEPGEGFSLPRNACRRGMRRYQALSSDNSAGGNSWRRQGKIAFDPSRCIGCFACSVACKQWNNLSLEEISYRWIEERDEGKFPQANRRFLSASCHQCANPACLAVCPVGAIMKNDISGLVSIDAAACIACGACREACNWDVPRVGRDGKMHKCDGCTECGKTLEGRPRCVAACPTGALLYCE